jgi:predicted Zn-dependent protease with MMP-like domain
MDRNSFERLVQEALDRIPSEFRSAMKNVAVVIQDWPGPEADEDTDGSEAGSLYGLYQGIPLPARTPDDSGTTPDVIFLYRKPLEEDFPDRDDLIREIEITLAHEIAHYFGFGEEKLEQYGYD